MAHTEDDAERLRAGATRWLSGIGGTTAAGWLDAMPDEVEADVYGGGGVVADLEVEVATVLDTEAALFLPTGTMAQAIALRLHAEDAGCTTVAMHPTSHPLLHEAESLPRAHGLDVRPIGDPDAPLTAEDLAAVEEPLGAVLVELPQRELGGRLPDWDALLAIVQVAADRGVALHLDGARLWECEPAYGRGADEVAALFDSVYVSFYKGLEALGGAALAGSEGFVDRARTWRHRLGGRPFGLWPAAASALHGLRTHRPAMAERLEHLRACAAALADLDGVRVSPDPPQAALCHVLLRTTPEAHRANLLAVADELGVWAVEHTVATGHPDWRRIELHASSNLMAFTPAELREVVAGLVA